MLDTLDRQMAVAGVYAEALFNLAREHNQVEEVRRDLGTLMEAVAQAPEIRSLLQSAAIDTDERARVIERVLRGRAHDLVTNTLLVMNRHGRSGLLGVLTRCFDLRRQDAAGQVEVTATSAVPLGAEQQAAVTRVAAERSGRQPLVRFVVDPDILGGLILQIGDWRYDYSLRRQLRNVTDRLHSRGERGLPVGRA